jgi:hypothetical protein
MVMDRTLVPLSGKLLPEDSKKNGCRESQHPSPHRGVGVEVNILTSEIVTVVA